MWWAALHLTYSKQNSLAGPVNEQAAMVVSSRLIANTIDVAYHKVAVN